MTATALRRLLVGAGHGTTGSVFLRRLMLAFLIKGSMPAFQAFGLRFFTTPAWNPVATPGSLRCAQAGQRDDPSQETVGNLAKAGLVPDGRLDALRACS